MTGLPPQANAERVAAQALMLANRVRKMRKQHRHWTRRDETTAYRLYDRDIPELPFAIDAYGPFLHVALYSRAADADAEAEAAWARAVVAEAARTLDVPPDHVALKLRQRQRGVSQYERQAARDQRLEVQESGHRFWVNLWDYLDTGLFLDHRETRRLVQRSVGGKRFLNLFAYTGSFGVYAAMGGATRIVQVDLSRTYLDWARDNLLLNRRGDDGCAFVAADAMGYLRDAALSGERFDLIVVDPPTFSNSKRMQGVFDVKRDHAALLGAVEAVLAPGGEILFSTNARHFAPDTAAMPWAHIEDITSLTRAPDFAGRHSHRAYRVRRLQARALGNAP